MNETVTDEDAADDQQYFANHPNLNYRIREIRNTTWILRRCARGELLRVPLRFLPTPGNDGTLDLRATWFEAAWPELDPDVRQTLINRARQAEKQRKKKQ
jgi:hypothetical protein